MPKFINAFGFIVFRVGGSTLLFWLFTLVGERFGFVPKEKN